MKRIIVTIVFSAFCILLCAQNDSTFFGLRLGQIYSEQEIVDAVSPYGKYVEKGECTDGLAVPYMFENVMWNGRLSPMVWVSCAERGHILTSVSFGIRATDVDNQESLEKIASSLCDSLSALDANAYYKYSQDSTSVQSFYASQSNKHIIIRVDCYYENNIVSLVGVNYIHLNATFQASMDSLFPPRPKIQDTFFGLKLGERYGINDVKRAFYENGDYLNSDNGGNSVSYTYTDVYFAGHKWNYFVVDITDDGRFYSIRAYDSLSDYSYNYDERNEAKQTYDSFKSRLDEKYGNVVEKDENGKCSSVYIGENDVAIVLSNERSKSSGGEYRRYVTIAYVQTDINNELANKSSDEL